MSHHRLARQPFTKKRQECAGTEKKWAVAGKSRRCFSFCPRQLTSPSRTHPQNSHRTFFGMRRRRCRRTRRTSFVANLQSPTSDALRDFTAHAKMLHTPPDIRKNDFICVQPHHEHRFSAQQKQRQSMFIRVHRERASGRRVVEPRKPRQKWTESHRKRTKFTRKRTVFSGNGQTFHQAFPKTISGAGAVVFRFSSIFRAAASEIGSVLSGGYSSCVVPSYAHSPTS